MNEKEHAVIDEWSKHNAANKDLANDMFEDILDMGAEVAPYHDRWASLDTAIEQVLDYGTRDDILALISKVGGYWYLRGKYNSMMNLMVKL